MDKLIFYRFYVPAGTCMISPLMWPVTPSPVDLFFNVSCSIYRSLLSLQVFLIISIHLNLSTNTLLLLLREGRVRFFFFFIGSWALVLWGVRAPEFLAAFSCLLMYYRLSQPVQSPMSYCLYIFIYIYVCVSGKTFKCNTRECVCESVNESHWLDFLTQLTCLIQLKRSIVCWMCLSISFIMTPCKNLIFYILIYGNSLSCICISLSHNRSSSCHLSHTVQLQTDLVEIGFILYLSSNFHVFYSIKLLEHLSSVTAAWKENV